MTRIHQVCAVFDVRPSEFFLEFPEPGMEEIVKNLVALPADKWALICKLLKLFVEIDQEKLAKLLQLLSR